MSATAKRTPSDAAHARGPATAVVIQPSGLRVPLPLDFSSFRAWVHSDEFPANGRIDFLDGEIDVNMCPEEYWTHGALKMTLSACLFRIVVQELKSGAVLTDSARISSPDANVSAEPDVIVLLKETVSSGRVKLIPKAGAEDGRCVEAEGPIDLVVECVSESSVAKDTRRLRALYHAAGVPEYWIADARKLPCRLTIHRLARDGYEETARDADGFVVSPLLRRSFRLVRTSPEVLFATYNLEERQAPPSA